MTFLEQRSSLNRPGVVVVVAAIQAVGIYAIVTGLGGIAVRTIIDSPFIGETVPPETMIQVDPPRPRPRDPAARPSGDPLQPPVGPVPGQGPVIDPGPIAPFDPGPLIEPVRPEPPGFPPRAAAPLGNPGTWASEADYPGADLRAGHQGSTRFRVAIDATGRVSDCTVIGSSGWPGLDAATCRLVGQRARFRPATDSTGNATGGSFTSAIRWVIPG